MSQSLNRNDLRIFSQLKERLRDRFRIHLQQSTQSMISLVIRGFQRDNQA